MGERELESKVKELVEQGNYVYSISKLNTFHNCQYCYHITYNLNNRGLDNIYSWAGGVFHNNLEEIYNSKKSEESLLKTLDNLLIEAELLNIKFPSEKIRNSWEADIRHFCNNFKKSKGKFVTEEGVLIEVFPKIWVQGYVDLQEFFENENALAIYDFKTSSKFDKNKLLEYGRQLILYAYAKEQQGYKIKKLAWNMLKYCLVCWQKKMCNRSKWVYEIRNNLEKDLSDLGFEEFEIPMMIDEAIKENNLNNMPKEIQNKYTLEDCIVEYPYTEELKQELLNYIKTTHEEIIKKDSTNEDDWKPLNINDKSSFFCIHLCNHRRNCKYLKQYIAEKNFEKKEAVDEMSQLFG